MTERIPATPPKIAPLPDDTHRPLWSVMIPAYNCSRYIEQAINSVLMQDPGSHLMQIQVVDDCSSDADLRTIVERVGKGRVEYYRKDKNMGSLRNFETCINRATGRLVHILHGDDFVKEGFYKAQLELFEKYPDAGASFTDFDYAGEDSTILYDGNKQRLMESAGKLENALLLLAQKQRLQPPAMVVKRSVYEKLGSFYAVEYGEDWEMWVRIAASYPMLYSPECLACYRVHTTNISANSLSSGQNIKDICKVIDIIQNYLPDDKKKELRREARKNFSIYYSWMSHKVYHDFRNPIAAIKQANGALGMSINKTTLFQASKLYAKVLIRYRRQPR